MISIRPLQTIAEYHACEALQRRVWAMPDGLDVAPLHLLLTAQKNGGLALGAFDDDELVGFVFGFPGLTEGGRLKHCSHMMGVAPGHQGEGLGYRLKLAQRDFVLGQGLDLVTWTYDPLESRNAYLNVHKLGAICRTYIRDLYGPMADGLNAGLPSDRFQVEWWVASERVARCLARDGTPPLPAWSEQPRLESSVIRPWMTCVSSECSVDAKPQPEVSGWGCFFLRGGEYAHRRDRNPSPATAVGPSF